jgi:DNA-binding NarL/FixJ family response regulator
LANPLSTGSLITTGDVLTGPLAVNALANGSAICPPSLRSATKSLVASIELASVFGTVTSRSISQWLLCGNHDRKIAELLPLSRQIVL